MANKNLSVIENEFKDLLENFDIRQKDDFIFEFLRIYDTPASTITRLKKGSGNLSSVDGETFLKQRIFFKETDSDDLIHAFTDAIGNEKLAKNKIRFVLITDFRRVLAKDMSTGDSLDTDFSKLEKDFVFFAPLAGYEKSSPAVKNRLDVKAIGMMTDLFDEIKKHNRIETTDEIEGLNTFFSRLLFCYFAEDTGIFPIEDVFTETIATTTNKDGSDLNERIQEIFEALNTSEKSDYSNHLKAFPYVGGAIFERPYINLHFSKRARELLIQAGRENDWSFINPDIFGSMMQAIVDTDKRANLGMHYTSVENIMKVINPLFLENLKEELEKTDTLNKIEKFLVRLNRLRIFDPACGSGNFLIVAYKELKALERQAYAKRTEITKVHQLEAIGYVRIENFYGIEIDHFAASLAQLSLWFVQQQENLKYETGHIKALPISDRPHIVNANALRIPWEEVCPRDEQAEIYIIGNPPYLGSKRQTESQKSDMKSVFSGFTDYKNLDFISCWFYLASKYIKNLNSKASLVSTNSICQGEQVFPLWDKILKLGIVIDYVHNSFLWNNEAKGKAAVFVVVVGLCNKDDKKNRRIYDNNTYKLVNNINPYLVAGENLIVSSVKKSISNFPEMKFGNMALDGGNFILSPEEVKEIIRENPNSQKFIKKFVGSKEFIRGEERYCLWLSDNDLEEAIQLEEIRNRIEKVKDFRNNSTRSNTVAAANFPHKFGEIRDMTKKQIIIPRVSSERREYLQIGYLIDGEIISDSALAIYNSEVFIMGVLSSNIHNLWVKAIGGRLKMDIRYSKDLCYNTFPFPKISDTKKQEIEEAVEEILDIRETYPTKTLADLYDPDKMPDDLRKAHQELDIIIESCYQKKPFKDDSERLEMLFKMYKEMTGK